VILVDGNVLVALDGILVVGGEGMNGIWGELDRDGLDELALVCNLAALLDGSLLRAFELIGAGAGLQGDHVGRRHVGCFDR